MPDIAVIPAVIAKYKALTAANFPDATIPSIWLANAPKQQGADYGGLQLRVPYTIIEDNGMNWEWDFETNSVQGSRFTLHVYYKSLGDCWRALKAILWNGQNPDQRDGLGFYQLDLAPPLYGNGAYLLPTRTISGSAGIDKDQNLIHVVSQDFEASTTLKGTG